MYELNKHYGWSKFIVVVPSVAIREGVYKSFEVTREHFAEEYGKKIRFFIYNSKQLTEIDRFAADSAINVMIINSQAFNARGKDANRIGMHLDEFRSRRPIDIIAKTNPILIIDEPQSVEGPATKQKMKEFNPMLTLRYSATHKADSIYNMVYRLDAMEAYNKRLVKKIPLVGNHLRDFLLRSKSAIKNSLYHSNWFEEMGFSYLGPLDGHDLHKLVSVLETAKKMRRPALVHINTVKGKGYEYAERNPKDFHGVPGFDISTGEYNQSKNSFSYFFGETLTELAEKDKRICAITAAMTEGTGLTAFREKFRNRFYDVGIAEQHAVTFGAALAVSGLLPVFAVYSSFLQRSVDQVIHDAAIMNVKLVLAVDRAGIVGEDGETHQGVFDAAFLNSIPNMTIYSPASYEQLHRDLYTAIYEEKGLAAVRYPRGAQGKRRIDFQGPYTVFGEGPYAFVTYGRMIQNVLEAQEELLKEGIGFRTVCLDRIKPIDSMAVSAVLDCRQVIFVEEGVQAGGIGEHYGALLAEGGFRGQYRIRAVGDVFLGQASVCESFQDCGLDALSLCGLAKEAVQNG